MIITWKFNVFLDNTHIHIHTHTHTERERDIYTERHTHIHTHRERQKISKLFCSCMSLMLGTMIEIITNGQPMG